jgi:hypothetical protein
MNYSIGAIKVDLETVGFSESPDLLSQVESKLRRQSID